MGKKGKAQGRAGKKHKAKGKGNDSVHNTPKHNYSQYNDSDWDDDNRISFKGFSGAKAKPSKFGTSASANVKYRHQPIAFVSVGVPQSALEEREQQLEETGPSTADDLDDDQSDDEDVGIDDSTIQTNIRMEADIQSTESGVANMAIDSSEVMEMEAETTTIRTETRIIVDEEPVRDPTPELQFVVDTVGDESLAANTRSTKSRGKRPVREPSPARSDSSEEVVMFRGRNKPTVINDPFSVPPPRQQPGPPKHESARASPHPTDDLLKALNGGATPSQTEAMSEATRHPEPQGPREEWTPAPKRRYGKNEKGKMRFDIGPTAAEQQRASVLMHLEQTAPVNTTKSELGAADTIAALQSDWKEALKTKKGKSASRSDRRGKRGRKKDNRALRANMTSEDEGDGEAAYDDYMQNLIAQMNEDDADREAMFIDMKANATLCRPSLMVDGREIAEDELLKHGRIDDDEGSGDEEDWESVDSEDNSEGDGDSSMNPDMDELSSDGLESELEYNEQEMWEDEEDLRQRRQDMMTDEQIARLLAKQQEFGIDGDELMIDDGGTYGSDDGFGDVGAARRGLVNLTNLTPSRTPNGGGRRRERDKKNNFVNASLLADTVEQYGENGFDVMDFERPSLRPRKKGRKGQLPPELDALSDDDLKETLNNQWNRDRSKKAQKKLEREELRHEGLLGSSGKKGRARLGTKYPLGMNMRNVHDELREFLQDEDLSQRAFPPMDKTDRAALHNICNALNLTSRSQGAGKNRFPVVSKTARTGEYSEEIFVKIVQASTRGFLSNRSTAKKLAKKAGKGGGRGGGFDKAAVSVRHGEIVGAAAPEISHTSFGAKLMAKHGWTKGMGLGKDNEGRTVPVEQIMRIGTAGLG